MYYIFDAAFAAFLIITAVQDARYREVKHWTVICLIVTALARMFYTGEYTVLYSLIPTAILVTMWYIKPDYCGAADIKVLGILLLYTGLSLGSLFLVLAACIFATSHMVISKRSTTPFCYWLGIAGCGYMAVRWFT